MAAQLPDKAGLTAHGCTFTAKDGALISAATTGVTIDSCMLIVDGGADIFNRVAPSPKSAGLSFTNNTVMLTKGVIQRAWLFAARFGAHLQQHVS